VVAYYYFDVDYKDLVDDSHDGLNSLLYEKLDLESHKWYTAVILW